MGQWPPTLLAGAYAEYIRTGGMRYLSRSSVAKKRIRYKSWEILEFGKKDGAVQITLSKHQKET